MRSGGYNKSVASDAWELGWRVLLSGLNSRLKMKRPSGKEDEIGSFVLLATSSSSSIALELVSWDE
jgi:hypothetical protein